MDIVKKELTLEEKATNYETMEHIHTVCHYLNLFIKEMLDRCEKHDQSKLCSPEVEIFTEFTNKLAGTTYGSDEYKKHLRSMKPTLDHHYANNAHHPEFYINGMEGMTLIDLIEMFADWVSATKRHKDGDIFKSIEINQKRFGYPDMLKKIFVRTALMIKNSE